MGSGADSVVKVDHGSIESQGATLARMKNELESDFNRAQQQVKALHESGAFTGLSGGSFQEKYTEWHTSIVKTLALMEDFGTHLGKASKAFGEVDSQFTIKG